MEYFIAEYTYSFWNGRKDKTITTTRIIKAIDIETARSIANEWWEKQQQSRKSAMLLDASYFIEHIIDSIDVHEPIDIKNV